MTDTIPVFGDVSPEAATAIIDCLLLSIIRAYPNDAKEKDIYQRLNEAKSALFGINIRRGPRGGDDLPELMHMAEAYIAERGKPEIGDKYTLKWPDENDDFYAAPQKLARAAIDARKEIDPSYKPHSDHKQRNLQQKFSRNIEDWLKLSYGQSGLPESVFRLKVQELAELLMPLGVAVALPFQSLRNINSAN